MPIKRELRPYFEGKHQLYHALGGDLRTAKENSHYHVAVFKEELRKAAEAYQRDTGNQVAVVSDPIDPAKLMVRQYRSMIDFDESMRNADHRYSRDGYTRRCFRIVRTYHHRTAASVADAVEHVMQCKLRHLATDYDQLMLEGVKPSKARRRIQPRVDAMIAVWRSQI